MGKADLRKFFKENDKPSVEALLLYVYEASKEAKTCIDFYLKPNEEEAYEKAVKKLEKVLNSSISVRECKKIIRDFEKLGASPEWVAKLHVGYVRVLTELIVAWGRDDEAFVNSVVIAYETMRDYIAVHGLEELYGKKVEAIEKYMAKNWIGFNELM